MMPVIPHIASECLDKFKIKTIYKWPEINKKYSRNR